MFDVFKNRLELTGTLTTVTALRISQGRSLEPIGSDLPVVKDALGQPLIPGSSFKGALRSRLESFLRGILGHGLSSTENSDLLRKLVANPSNEAEWSLTANEAKILKNMSFDGLVRLTWFNDLKRDNQTVEHDDWSEFLGLPLIRLAKIIQFKDDLDAGRALPPPEQLEFPEDLQHTDKLPDSEEIQELKKQYVSSDAALTKAMVCETDLASKLFGSPWVSSKFQVRDLTVLSETWFGQYQERDGVSIDRDTETAADGRLYDFQVVPAGVQFEFKAIFENADTATIKNPETGEDEEIGYWELGLLMVGLQQFKMQQIPLGGGCSRGLGVVELDINKVVWVDPEGEPSALLTYMQHLATGDLSEYEHASFEGLTTDWTSALVSYLSWQARNQKTAAVEA